MTQPSKPATFLISPERRRIANIFHTHSQKAIAELGTNYDVTLQGRFGTKSIRIEIEIDPQKEIP